MIQIPVSGYHAHVYFDSESRQSAEAFQKLIHERLGSTLRYLGNLIDRPIGPHPIPMFEIGFLPEQFAAVMNLLMQNHGGHSVLIHPLTGDELRDHTTHALWLGKQLVLDLRQL